MLLGHLIYSSPRPIPQMLHNDPIAAVTADVIAWRHRIHANPELGFQEHATARFVADQLRACGLEVHEGIGGTGVVGDAASPDRAGIAPLAMCWNSSMRFPSWSIPESRMPPPTKA